MDAMITKYTVEAFTAGLALTFAFGAVALPFFFLLDKRERYLRRKSRKTKG